MQNKLAEIATELSKEKIAANQDNVNIALENALQAELIAERDINRMGYHYLMEKKNPAMAILVFTYNIHAYPESFNVYDSLGEAYMVDSQNALAEKYYKKSLELNPKNNNAKEMLGKMGVTIDENHIQSYTRT